MWYASCAYGDPNDRICTEKEPHDLKVQINPAAVSYDHTTLNTPVLVQSLRLRHVMFIGSGVYTVSNMETGSREQFRGMNTLSGFANWISSNPFSCQHPVGLYKYPASDSVLNIRILNRELEIFWKPFAPKAGLL